MLFNAYPANMCTRTYIAHAHHTDLQVYDNTLTSLSNSVHLYLSIYLSTLQSISFQTFFVQVFKIGVDSWKFSMLLLYILWDDWPIFMISGSNQQLQQELEYSLLKPDCHSWWISKMQSDTLEERYALKLCLKLGQKCHRNVWNASDCFWSILHEWSISFWVA